MHHLTEHITENMHDHTRREICDELASTNDPKRRQYLLGLLAAFTRQDLDNDAARLRLSAVVMAPVDDGQDPERWDGLQ